MKRLILTMVLSYIFSFITWAICFSTQEEVTAETLTKFWLAYPLYSAVSGIIIFLSLYFILPALFKAFMDKYSKKDE